MESIITIGTTTPSIPAEGIPAEGGSYTIKVTSNTTWNTTDPRNLTVTSDTATQFKVSVAANTSVEAREVSVSAVTTDGTKTVNWVYQQQGVATPTLELGTETPAIDGEIPAAGGTYSIPVNSNVAWEALALNLATIKTKTDNTLVVVVPENTRYATEAPSVKVQTVGGDEVRVWSRTQAAKPDTEE